MQLATIDLAIFVAYVVTLITIGYLVSRERSGHEKNTSDYFLAGKGLPWWAVGASLIAANISAEQIIGMSGSGYAIGLAIASYEWMAAITLILVGKYFLPVFVKKGIYTMPQFLEQRYDSRVKIVLAIFWLGVYVFVNLTSVLWLGSLAINAIAGVDLFYGLLFLGLFSAAYSLYGGLKAVALTDIIQVVLLVIGGLVLSYLALSLIGEQIGGGLLAGFSELTRAAPEKFNMILAKDNPHYMSLPGLSVLLGGMWVVNFAYWGFNQYIIQRALGARSIEEGQKGIAFAAYLKLLMPVIVVLPGIAATVLLPQLERPDQAYPNLMNLMPAGFKGLIFAALVAAIVSSLASMTNSISTIFTMDIYSRYQPRRSEKHYVRVGRIVALSSLILGMICAQPLLGQFDQAFQYIQEFTGFFTPGITVLFLLGVFWPLATANSALVAAIGSAVLSAMFWRWWPELPFMDRIGITFLICLSLAVIVSLWETRNREDSRGGEIASLGEINFTTGSTFNLAAVGVTLILIALYATWW